MRVGVPRLSSRLTYVVCWVPTIFEMATVALTLEAPQCPLYM